MRAVVAERHFDGRKGVGNGDGDWAERVSRESWKSRDEPHKEMGPFGGGLWGSRLLGKVGRDCRRRWVNNAVVGVALDRFAVVVEAATVGVVGKEFAKEVVFGGGIVAARADFATASGRFGVLDAATEAATEGTGKFALIFRIGKRVNWEVGV